MTLVQVERNRPLADLMCTRCVPVKIKLIIRRRLRTEVSSAPVPERPRAGAAALRLTAPIELLRVVDVELFVGNEAPYFPDDEVDARRVNALLPTLRKDARQFLTGVCRHRTSLAPLAPRQAFTKPPYGTRDRTRGIGFAADERGVAWIVEQWMPRSIFD